MHLWSVQLIGGAWYVVHPVKRGKRIGPARSRGVNWRDRAQAEADRRNSYLARRP